MASLGTAFIDVAADLGTFESQLAGALENALGKNKFVQVLATSAAAGVAAVIKEFAPLEREILKIFQIQGQEATDAMFDAVSDSVLDVASEIGLPAQDVGKAIAQGIARGFDQEEAIDLSRVGGDLAVALGENLVPATRAIAGAVNAFGEDILSVEKAAGGLFQISNLTGTSMTELAQQIGNAAPDAAGAGVSFEEMGAAIATMTQNGQTAAEATTQLRTLINALTDQNSIAGKSFKEISGKTFPQFIKSGGTLAETIGLIQKASQQTGISTRTLTGDINSNRAVLSLAGAGYERFLQNTQDIQGGQEDLAQAVETANEGFIRQFKVGLNDARVGLQRVAIAARPLLQVLGERLSGVLSGAGDLLEGLGKRLEGIDLTAFADKVDQGISFLGTALAPVGRLVQALFSLLQGLDWGAVGAGIQAALVPIGAVVAAISTGIDLLAAAIEKVTPAFQAVFNAVAPILEPLGLLASGVGVLLVSLPILAGILGGLAGAMGAVATGARVMWAALTGPVGIVIALGTAFYLAWQNSETFRKGVVTAVNAVKDAIITGVEWMVRSIFYIPRAWLEAAEAILNSLSFLPDWMGGGVIDGAADGVRTLLRHIDTLEQGVHGLASAARAADWELRNALSSSLKLQEQAAQQGLWFGNADTNKALEEALKGPKAGPKNPFAGLNPNTGGLADLFDKDKKKAADEAARITKRITDMLRGIFEAATRLTKNIGEKSLSEIQNGFEGLTDKYKDAIQFATEEGRKSTAKMLKKSLKDVQSFERQLTKLAAKREGVTENLKTATDELKRLRQESDSFETSLKAAFVNIGSVAEASAGIGVTFRGIRNNLKDAINTTRLFNDAIRQLQKLGLNETSLMQLAQAGPEALDQARALARSGASGIKEINKLQAELDKLATKNADNLADDFFNAGINAAKGLVKGLKSQEAALIAQMEKLAKSMVSAIKRELKIKSPSGVFDEEVGRMIPAGAARGVQRGIPELVAAIEQMSAAASTTTFGAGSVQVNGVSDPNAAYRAGILAGEGIATVLERRNTASRLAGV